MKRNNNNIRSFYFLVCLGLLLLLVQTALAGTTTAPERGFNPGRSYSISDIETISVESGNLMLNMPLTSLPAGRGGMSAGLSLHYNSKLWDVDSADEIYPATGSIMALDRSEDGGWKYGYFYQFKIENDESTGYSSTGNSYSPWIVMPDGSKHRLCVLDSSGNPDCKFTTYSTNSYVDYFTLDGTYLKLRVNGNGTTDPMAMTWTLSMPDGSQIVNRPASGIAQRTMDRNGNYIDIIENTADSNYSSHKTTYIQDQLGRRIVIEYSKATDEDWIRFDGFGGEDLVTIIKWKTINIKKLYRACPAGCTPIQLTNQNLDVDFRVADRIYLPAPITGPAKFGGLFYSFDYNNDLVPNSNPQATVGWGEVKQVTLPSGAYSTYDYTTDNETGGSVLANWVIHNRPSRKQLHYAEQYNGTTTSKTDTSTYSGYTTTGPDGGVTTQYYGPVQGYALGTGDVQLKTVRPDESISESFYVANNPIALGYYPQVVNSFVKYEYTTIADAGGNPSKTAIKEYSRDKNGNVTEVKEYDFVAYSTVPRDSNGIVTGLPSGISSSLKRITKTAYYNDTPDASSTTYTDIDSYHLASSSRLRSLAYSVEVQAAGNTPKSRSEITYDYTNYSTNTVGGNAVQTKSWDSTKGSYSNPLTSSNWITTSATYNGYGMPLTATDANGNVSQITYGTVGSYLDLYPTQTVAAYGTSVARTSAATYDFYTGLPLTSTDVNNNVTNATEYDALGRPRKAITAQVTALESWTQTEYHDADRFVVVKSDLETKGDGKKVATQFYDQLGRVRLSKTLEDAATQSASNETDGIKVQTRYSTGNPISYQLTSNPYRAAFPSNETAPTMGWTRSKSVNTRRHSEVETFSGASLPAPWGSNSTSTGVVQTDADANTMTVTDQAGKLRRSVTNALGQLKRVDEPTDTGGLGAIDTPNQPTNYSYDTLNNLTTVNQGIQSRSFSYNSLSRLLNATNPESGTFQYTYDPNGNLLTKADARNITTTFSYDALNRVILRDYSESTPDVTYAYDASQVEFSKGKLTKVSSSVSETSFTAFDAQGRVTNSQQKTDGQIYNFSYTYNLHDDLLTQTYPSGKVVEFNYDASGELSRVGTPSGQTFANSFGYTPSGEIDKLRLGNGRWETTQFNSRRQITQIGLGYSATDTGIWKTNYEYGDWEGTSLNAQKNNGNLARQTITVPTIAQATGFTAVQTHTYDKLDRLKSAAETIGGNQTWKQTFVYDQFGNRRFDSNQTTIPSSIENQDIVNPNINAANNRISSQGYDYDLSGNLTSNAQNRSFSYDAENKQTSISDSNGGVATYAYDPDGRRVKKSTTSNSETIIFVYDAFGKLTAEYSTHLSQNPQVSYLISDTLGSPRVISNQNGEVASRRDFMPFGEELTVATGSRTTAQRYSIDDNVRQKFTTYKRDDESGLDFAESRYYSPKWGRFTSPDEFSGGPDELFDFADTATDNPTFYAELNRPQSLNKYQYAYNNPCKFVDSDGHRPDGCIQQVAGAVVGAVIGAVGGGFIGGVIGTAVGGGGGGLACSPAGPPGAALCGAAGATTLGGIGSLAGAVAGGVIGATVGARAVPCPETATRASSSAGGTATAGAGTAVPSSTTSKMAQHGKKNIRRGNDPLYKLPKAGLIAALNAAKKARDTALEKKIETILKGQGHKGSRPKKDIPKPRKNTSNNDQSDGNN